VCAAWSGAQAGRAAAPEERDGFGACRLLELLCPIAGQHTAFVRPIVSPGLYGCQEEEEAGTGYSCEHQRGTGQREQDQCRGDALHSSPAQNSEITPIHPIQDCLV